MFTRFIEERTFFSDKYTSLAFFDECLNRIESTENADFSTFQLIEPDDGIKHDSAVTTFISDPESLINSSVYSQVFRYNKFGPFNHDFFLKEPILNHFDNHRKSSVESRSFENSGWNYLLGSSSNLDSLQQQKASSSPMLIKRTKHEVRSAQRTAKRLAETPLTWSKCLISYCYSLWFVHLHSYVHIGDQQTMKTKLKIAYNVLLRMQSLDLHPLDEVCYRILMLLAGIYNQPMLAIKILLEMKRNNVVPNALTYAYYNKAVLEWKPEKTGGNIYWKKLRRTVEVTGYLRRLGKSNTERRLKSELSSSDLERIEKTSTNDLSSINNILPTLDKHEALFSRQTTNKTNSSFRDKKLNKNRSLFEKTQRPSSIIRGSSTNRFSNLINYSEEAGLLINSQIYQSNIKDKRKKRRRHSSNRSCDEYSDQGTQFSLNKIKEEFLSISPQSSSTMMIPRRNFFRSQSLSVYKHSNLINDHHQTKTILERQHRRTPSSQIDEHDNVLLPSLNNHSSEGSLSNKNSTLRRSSQISTSNCSDEHINKNLQSMESLNSENSTFSPLKDAIKNINVPFFSENKVTSTLRSSFRTVKKFSKSQFANSPLFKYSTSFTRQQSVTGDQESTKNDTLHENGVSSESLNNEIKCNTTMTRSTTLPMSISSTVSNESESSKKSNLSIETESTSNTNEHSTSEMTKSHSSNDFNSIWSNKFSTNKSMDYFNSTFKFATNTMNRLSEIKSTLSASNSNSPIKPTTSDQQNDSTNASTTQTTTNNNALFTNLGQNTSTLLSNLANMVNKFPTNVIPLSEYCEQLYFDTTDGISELGKQPSEYVSDKFFEKLEQQYKLNDETSTKHLLKIEITSCSKCDNCCAILYDEEIMSEWLPDDSNLNTTCRYCEKPFVPKLTIKVKYNSNFLNLNNENHLLDSSVEEDKNEEDFKDYKKLSVVYSSPLCLRKELESIVDNEGDFCLKNSEFTLKHDIIFWNLVWYFNRINLPTHLPGLYLEQFLNEKSIEDFKELDPNSLDHRNVSVICLMDNEDLYEDIPKPMYRFWKKSYLKDSEETSSLVSALLTEKKSDPNKIIFNGLLNFICADNLVDAIRVFIYEKRKNNKEYFRTKYVYSIYRDLLFLLFSAYDRNTIDQVAFDRVYRHAYDQLTSEETKFMRITDKPPSLKATFCRRSFQHLVLKVNP